MPETVRSIAPLVARALQIHGQPTVVWLVFELRALLVKWVGSTEVSRIYLGPAPQDCSLLAFLYGQLIPGQQGIVRSWLIKQLEANPAGMESCLTARQVFVTRRLLVKEQKRLSGGKVVFDKCEADHIVGLYYTLVRLWQILFGPHGAGLSAGDAIELVVFCVNAANNMKYARLTSTVMNQVTAQLTKEHIIGEREIKQLGAIAQHTHMKSDAGVYSFRSFVESPGLRDYTLFVMAEGYAAYVWDLLSGSSSTLSPAVARALLSLAERAFHDLLRLLADANPAAVAKVRAAVGPRAAATFFPSEPP